MRQVVEDLDGTVVAVPHSIAATYFSVGLAYDPTLADLFDGIVLQSPPALHEGSGEGLGRTDTRMNSQSARDFVSFLEFSGIGYLREPSAMDGIDIYPFCGVHDSPFQIGSKSFMSLIANILDIADSG